MTFPSTSSEQNKLLKTTLKSLIDRKNRFLRNVEAKRSIFANAKKKTTAKQQALEDLEAKAAAAKAEVDAAKRKEDEAETELDDDVVVLGEIEEQERKILQDLVEAENNLLILKDIVEHHKTAQGRAKLPLGSEATPDDMRRAVSEFVPSFQALCSDHDCPVDTLKKVLNFLFLNGVESAQISMLARENVVLLRKQLAKILYPDLRPARERSLSPKSKEKALAAELYEDAEAIEKEFEGERQAKRKCSVATDVPLTKKLKLAPAVLEEVMSVLSAQALAALLGEDFQDEQSCASDAEEEEKDTSET
jgi:hypothetical protein